MKVWDSKPQEVRVVTGIRILVAPEITLVVEYDDGDSERWPLEKLLQHTYVKARHSENTGSSTEGAEWLRQ